MIFRYDFGAPLDTGAVIRHIPAEKGVPGFFDVSREGEKIRFSIALSRDDMIFGLGQNVRGINKRGHLYRSWNSDEFHHEETTKSLYGSHNFLVFRRTEGNFGVFFDDPGAVEFDLGYTSADRAVITSENGNLSLYIIPGDSLKEIVRSFRRLIGRSYIPPKWAFGYIQSRWGYASEEELRHIVHEHRSRHIPLDGLCVDIDYMEQYKDFTWNSSTFSDPVSLNRDMKEDFCLDLDLRSFGNLKLKEHILLHHDDVKAVNTEENPGNVAPTAGPGGKVDGGKAEIKLPALSWNVLRFQ